MTRLDHLRRLVAMLCMAFSGTAFAQLPPAIVWQGSYGGSQLDWSQSMDVGPDGAVIVAGWTDSNDGQVTGYHGGRDIWVIKLSSAGELLWQRCLGGTSIEQAAGVCAASDGGYLVAGFTQSNNGDVSGNHGNKDAWLVKLSATGEIEWQRCMGGSDYDEFNGVQELSTGGFIAVGRTGSTNGDVSFNNGGQDLWLVKVNTDGQIVWERSLGGSSGDWGFRVQELSDGFVIAGISSSNDGDVSGGHGSLDMWLVRTDEQGSILWQLSIGGSGIENLNAVTSTNDGGFALAGTTFSSDGDCACNNSPGPALIGDAVVAKVSGTGELEWLRCLATVCAESGREIVELADGTLRMLGDAQPSSGSTCVTGLIGLTSVWLVDLDPSGNEVHQACYGGIGIDWGGYSAAFGANGDLYVTGGSQSPDGFDVTGNHGGIDFWVFQLTDQLNLMRGTIYADLDADQAQGAQEPPVPFHAVQETGTGRIAFASATGEYALAVLGAGDHEAVPAPLSHYVPAPPEQLASFSGVQQELAGADFAMQPLGSVQDLSIWLVPLGDFRPGFAASYVLHYRNSGTIASPATIDFTAGNWLTITQTVPPPVGGWPNTPTWFVPSLAPLEEGTILVHAQVDAAAPLGDIIASQATITPSAGDALPEDNLSEPLVTVVGSFDPNDILVDREEVDVFELSGGVRLTYRIRFQNTGTASAINVRVENEPPVGTILSSLHVISASHPMSLSYSAHTNRLVFEFPNIDLAPMSTNEPESHGYVLYDLLLAEDLLPGETVPNTASIFFDFNPPIVTNTAITTITVGMGSAMRAREQGLLAYPNPAGDALWVQLDAGWAGAELRVVDPLGRTVLRERALGQNHRVDCSRLAIGHYQLLVRSSQGERTLRFVRQ